jgi:hypothetical protein
MQISLMGISKHSFRYKGHDASELFRIIGQRSSH